MRREEEGELRSILNHGDLSVLSFHATKVFNTFEGGAIICPDAKTKQRIDHLKNFGFVNETTVVATGINGKMSEFNAALGMVQLKHVDNHIAARGAVEARYRELLQGVPGVRFLDRPTGVTPNHSYLPILLGPDYALGRDGLYQRLRENDVMARRYFYPLISDFPMYRGLASADPAGLPVARAASDQVLCVPIYPALQDEDVVRIAEVIRSGAVRAVAREEEPLLLAA